MDVRIGVIHTPKELDIEVADDVDRDQLVKSIEKTLGSDTGILWLTDRKGSRIGIPAARIAYVQIGAHEDRRVGFGAP